jgi:hypothetical protein
LRGRIVIDHTAIGVQVFLDVLAQLQLHQVPIDGVVLGDADEVAAEQNTGHEGQVEDLLGQR